MADRALETRGAAGGLAWLPILALLAGAAALLLLAAAPLGPHVGWWGFRRVFAMVAWSRDVGLVAAALAALAVIARRTALRRGQIALLLATLLVGVGLTYVPWQYRQLRGPVPSINDVTTDPENPPPLAASLPARAAEEAGPTDYPGAAVARQQRAAYPDIAPLHLARPPNEAFGLALAMARAMPRTQILASEPKTGLIEGSQSTLWAALTDDFVIRVAAEGGGSRVDMRSVSRQGKGDQGYNAARIRRYMAALRQAAGGATSSGPTG